MMPMPAAVTASDGSRYPMQHMVVTALLTLPDGEGDNDAIEEAVITQLAPADRIELASDPRRWVALYNGIASAKSNLKRAGLVETTGYRRWRLTAQGRASDVSVRNGNISGSRSRASRLADVWAHLPEAPPSHAALQAMGSHELVSLYAEVVDELKRRTVIRSDNLVGDYAERLVAGALDGALAPRSRRGFDIETERWGRIQVKARRVPDPDSNGKLQLGIFRSGESFSLLAVVLFDRHLRVGRAVLIPACVVEAELGNHIERVNGRVLYATDRLMFHDQAEDLTDRLRLAAQRHPGSGGRPRQ